MSVFVFYMQHILYTIDTCEKENFSMYTYGKCEQKIISTKTIHVY